MMHYMNFDAAALLPNKDETLFDYWLSFAPVAPLLGVDYRPAVAFGLAVETPAVSAPMAPAETRVATPVEEAEVVTPAPVKAEEPEVETPKAAAPAPAPGPQDSDLVRIKGIGAKLQDQLNGLGLYTVAQLAEYDDAQIAALSEGMTSFKDRPVRNAWVDQAKALIG